MQWIKSRNCYIMDDKQSKQFPKFELCFVPKLRYSSKCSAQNYRERMERYMWSLRIAVLGRLQGVTSFAKPEKP